MLEALANSKVIVYERYEYVRVCKEVKAPVSSDFPVEWIVNKIRRDKRIAYPYVELITSKIYGYHQVVNSNELVDGYRLLRDNCGKFSIETISVKSLKDAVAFSQSQTEGRNVRDNPAFVDALLKVSDWQIIVDIVNFPILFFIPVRSMILKQFLDECEFTQNENNKFVSKNKGGLFVSSKGNFNCSASREKFYEKVCGEPFASLVSNRRFREIDVDLSSYEIKTVEKVRDILCLKSQ